MANGITITFFGETNEAFKGLQHSYHYEDDFVYEGGLVNEDIRELQELG